jgi:hypothetical protein
MGLIDISLKYHRSLFRLTYAFLLVERARPLGLKKLLVYFHIYLIATELSSISGTPAQLNKALLMVLHQPGKW